jgi:bis(5'-nucleosidyl)-tetraphosphatase
MKNSNRQPDQDYEESAGAVVFYNHERRTKYLLLYESTAETPYWGMPKGFLEAGEDAMAAAVREIKEETGLKFDLLPGFKERVEYSFRWKGKAINKRVTFFLAEARTKGVKVSAEHEGYVWVPIEEAVRTTPYDNYRHILRKADRHVASVRISSRS